MKITLGRTSDFMIVILPFKDRFLAFHTHNIFLMSSNRSSEFKLTISLTFFENHTPKVLKQPVIILISANDNGFL